jgi:hypothetical protein
MNVNAKGAYGLIEVIRDLTRKGYECFLPFDDHGPVDVIAMDRETFKTYRLQVKYRTAEGGMVEVQFRTISMGVHSKINFDAIDGWACYNPDADVVVYISKGDIDETKKAVKFRVRETLKGTSPIPMYDTFKELKEWH